MKDMDYIFAVAQIRVKEKALLTDADINQMISMKDEASVLQFLSDRGWGDPSSSHVTSEQMLSAEEEKNLAMMREMKIDPKVLEVLSFPQLYHNLKTAIKEVCTQETVPGIFYALDRYDGKEMERILREKDYSRLPEHMRATAQRAFEEMLSTRDAQRCDIIVDRACLEAMAAAAGKLKQPMVLKYITDQVAVADIRIAARSVRTGKSMNFLKEAIAEGSSLDAAAVCTAAAKGEEALYAYLESHGFAEAAAALKESPSAFERWCDNRLMQSIRPQKMNSVSIGPVVAYYLARQNEIKMARIIMTAKANGFSEEVIRERAREMYV
ncbi:MAG: V-type ATPase subunit [Lachnospiraceae bacterium]|nr:V-type ATPase subunit [Lachnospiraceae bacterium]